MAERKHDKDAPVVDARVLRTVEQTINDPLPPPDPSQEEADAILMGEYTGEDEAPPEGGVTARQKREEDDRKKREAKASSEQAPGYQTR